MRNIKKKNANCGEKKGRIWGCFFFCIFQLWEKNVAKTTFDRRIRNDGGTRKNNYYNIVYSI